VIRYFIAGSFRASARGIIGALAAAGEPVVFVRRPADGATAAMCSELGAVRVRAGELATFKANVNYTGRTSLEVGIRVIAENLTSNEKRHCLSCYFTMVAKDENGHTKPVPPLIIEHEIERKLFEAGEMRRQMRDEIRRRNQALRVVGPDEIRPV
jgi:hypothetical protein